MKAKVTARQPGAAARGRTIPPANVGLTLGRAVQLARSGPTCLDSAAVSVLQSHSGNAAVADLLGGNVAGARQPAGENVLRLDAHPRYGAAASLIERPHGRLAVQRFDPGVGACPAPPAAPAGRTADQDPKFSVVKGDISAKGKAVGEHPTAKAEAKSAQEASVPPTDDKEAQAKAAQADKMGAAKPGAFDKAAFISAVNAAVAAQAPKNLDEADKFATSGKAEGMKAQVMDKVSKGKSDSARDITEATKESPDASKAVEKPATPLKPPPEPPQPVPPDPKMAVPDKAPAGQTELGAANCETEGQMATAGVTEQQLANSNQPEFTDALAAKKTGEAHDATAPAAARQEEQKHLTEATSQAGAAGKAAIEGMVGAKAAAGLKSSAAKSATKGRDDAKRAEVTAKVKGIFDGAKTDVEKILADLDGQVDKRFEDGERAAKDAFTADHKTRMERYKDERYSGAAGVLRWGHDLFAGLPPEANNIFLESKQVYESKMQAVISDIADLAGSELTRAKQRIEQGRQDIKGFVASQPKELQNFANDAAKDIGTQFEELERSVDEKQSSLIDSLASKYVEASNAVDAEIKQLQEENKGLWDKAKEAIGGAIETIGKLKDMLLGVLARAAGAINKIIQDPIGFLGNLVNAVKTGVMNFAANILEHLKAGLKAWLFGALAEAGIEIPDTFDIKGILKLILSILGLTWNSIRARILKVIPEPVLSALETTFEVVGILVREGVGGLWKWVVEKLGDIKEMVLGQIKEFVVESIVKAGITWIIGLLNPAAAFIKACKAIYDIVMFLVEKASQIKEFVDSVLDSVESIAAGGAGAVAGLIERTLANAVPMVIGFLASLLGLGGISEKIKSILEMVQKPVMSVVDAVIGSVVKAGKKLFAKLFGKKDKRPPAERKAALDTAMGEGQSALTDHSLDEKGVRARLSSIKQSHRVKTLDLVIDSASDTSETMHIVGANSPTVTGPLVTRPRTVFVQRTTEDDLRASGASVTKTPTAVNITELVERLWEEVVATLAPERAGGQVTRLSKSAADQVWRVLSDRITGAPSKEGQAAASATVRERLDYAVGATGEELDARRVYAALTAAARAVKALYPEGALNLQIHHDERVGENPATFLHDRASRLRPQIQSKVEAQFQGRPLTREQLEVEVRERLELQLRDEIFTQTDETRGKGKNATLAEEVDMIAVAQGPHADVHAEERAEKKAEKQRQEDIAKGWMPI